MSKELISFKKTSGLFTLQYSIQEENHIFPVNQTIILLEEMGFAISNKSTLQKSTIELRSNDNVAYLTRKELNFLNNLPSGKAEYLKSKLHELLVTRIKILNQAAKQNSNAAIINLLQDQRRASVSDTYYSLFNSLGSLIEHTKEIHLKEIFQQQTTIQELNFEDNRKHGTPEEAKKIINRTAKVIETLKKKSFTVDEHILNFANESLSRTNSFLWLLISTYFIDKELSISETINTPVEEDLEGNSIDDKKDEIINSDMEEKKFLQEKWEKIINGLKEFIYIIDIESFAIGVSGREKFEKDFVEVYKDYKSSIGNENNPETVYGILGCFYLYTYALRQMADYDGSFDSRIDVKVNSLLCYYIELFNEFVISFTENIEYKEENKKIKRITSVRPIQLSPQHEENSSKLLFHISGILVVTELDVVNLYKKLLQHDAYKPIAVNDRMVIPSEADNSLIIDRVLPNMNIKFRISLSENVLWIDVIGGKSNSIYGDDERILKDYVNNMNVSALENIIVNQVIKQEILPLVSTNKLLYLGNIACYHKFEECFVYNINNLGLHSPSVQFYLDNRLKRKLEILKNNEVNKEIFLARGLIFNRNNFNKEATHKQIIRNLRVRIDKHESDSILVIPLYFFYEASKKEIEEIQSLMFEFVNNYEFRYTLIFLPITKDILDELYRGDDLYFDYKSDELTDSHIKIIREQLNIDQESIVPSTQETEGELEAVNSGPAVQETDTDNELKTVNPVLK
ncbi:hypothetical protein [Priestia aryabhattai]|uniref:hypothetical protein n=1 Tax=Priestia aryabhattai TaxID=412384 RepID=UPI0032E8A515